MEYAKLLKIDTHKLDTEWINQPGLYMFWAEKASVARADMDKQRFTLDVYEAELASKIRQNPGQYGLEKITESAIQQKILLDEKYQKLNIKHIDAKTEADNLNKLTVALEQRKKALENLVFLTQQGYFSTPDVRRRRGVKGEKE